MSMRIHLTLSKHNRLISYLY